jgi:hypothetical protein
LTVYDQANYVTLWLHGRTSISTSYVRSIEKDIDLSNTARINSPA